MKSKFPPPKRDIPVDLAPQSPAAAFERLVDLVRNSRFLINADPDYVLGLVRPFLANPGRDEAYVREIAEAYAYASVTDFLSKLPGIRLIGRFSKPFQRRMEDSSPDFIQRLRALEAALKNELRPGSVTIHVKPTRYIETPPGFGNGHLLRYRIQVQTLVEDSVDDVLEAVGLDIRVAAENAEVQVDDISPKAAFSSVSRKSAAAIQVGIKQTRADKHVVAGEISGGGAKASSSLESSTSQEESLSLSQGNEETVARVEQYLVARKVGNRALWRILSGVGPIDAAGEEYSIDVLVPEDVHEIDLHVEARLEWFRAGIVPAEVRRRVKLPAVDAKK